MKRTIIQISLCSLFVWLLAACVPLSQTAVDLPESAGTDTSAQTGSFLQPGEEPSRCVEPAYGQQLWVDEIYGYCLIVPIEYVSWAAEPGAVSLVKGDIMNHLDPRVEITVTDGAESTLEEAADQWAADFGIPGVAVERSRITVDGVDSVMLDNLPGQDLNRRVAAVHNGRLYAFFFTPLDAAMDPFYATALDSFRFLDGPGSELSLVYTGPVEVGSNNPSKCTGMSLDGSQNATIFSCDGTSQIVPLGKRLALDWADFQTRFDAFTYGTPTETLVFDGIGEPASKPWQRAILAWSRTTHAELATGHAGATGRTVLSWFYAPLPEQPDVCTHLTVLNYGYAYAQTVNCEGGDVIDAKGDWLTDAELAQLDAWLYGYAPLYLYQNYLDGQGSQTMDGTESAAVAHWATDLYARLWPQ